MFTKCTIVRYAEIGLKGHNRIEFENRLVRNIKDYLVKKSIPHKSVERKFSRILIYSEEKINLKPVFGITSFSAAIQTEAKLDNIKNGLDSLVPQDTDKKTFRTTVNRQDKTFELNSQELQKALGDHINQKTGMEVKLKGADHEFFVDLFNNKAYLFMEKQQAFGGLPVGCEGYAYSSLKTKEDVLASLLLMKRGVAVLSDNPEIPGLMQKYEYGFRIRTNKKEKPEIIVSGQTLKNMTTHSPDILILRPLIGLDDGIIGKKMKIFEEAV